MANSTSTTSTHDSSTHRTSTHDADGGRERPPLLRLLVYFALAVLGAFGALVITSRRPRFERRWEDFDDLDEDLADELGSPVTEGPRPSPAVHSQSLEVEGPVGRLFVDDGGAPGNPVLFVHGLGGSSRQWQAQLARLRQQRRAVALDLRGHGDSDPAPDPESYTLDGYVEDLAAVADSLDLERFVLVGHSLGGAVAVEYAARYPERVAGLLLVDPNGDQTTIPRKESSGFLEALGKDPTGEMEWYFKQILVGAETGVADQVLADLRLADAEAFGPSLESAFNTSPLPSLAIYPGPRLSVISEMNSLPYSLHNLVEDLPWKLIPGTSHWLMMDRPEDFHLTLEEFLASVPAEARV